MKAVLFFGCILTSLTSFAGEIACPFSASTLVLKKTVSIEPYKVLPLSQKTLSDGRKMICTLITNQYTEDKKNLNIGTEFNISKCHGWDGGGATQSYIWINTSNPFVDKISCQTADGSYAVTVPELKEGLAEVVEFKGNTPVNPPPPPPQNFTASCKAGPVRASVFACTPAPGNTGGVIIPGAYESARDCAINEAMGSCRLAGYANCPVVLISNLGFTSEDSPSPTWGYCRVKVSVRGQ